MDNGETPSINRMTIAPIIRIWGFTMPTNCLNARLGTKRNHPVPYILNFIKIAQNMIKLNHFTKNLQRVILSDFFYLFLGMIFFPIFSYFLKINKNALFFMMKLLFRFTFRYEVSKCSS